jgi:hypothetical protein
MKRPLDQSNSVELSDLPFAREAQIDALRALGARVTVWRSDYQHPDGWPQRYKVVLTFTGFTGQPVTLPAHSPVTDIKMLT